MGAGMNVCLRVAMAWLTLTVAAVADDVLGPRSFSDVEGRAILAVITGLEGEELRLRRPEIVGEFRVPLARLSVLDQRYIAENRERILEALALPPETEFIRALRRDFLVTNARRGGALGPAPEEAWARTRRFVVVAGVPDEPRMVREIGRSWAEWAAGEKEVALLWAGPAARGGAPVPEAERRLARELPGAFAILSGAALREAYARERAELDVLAEEQAPGRPGLFFATWAERTAAERRRWRSRVLARQEAYWPTWVDSGLVVAGDGGDGALIFVCDREGKPLATEGEWAGPAPSRMEPFPAREPVVAGPRDGAGWIEFVAGTVHTFRMARGIRAAEVVGMTPETVIVRPQGGSGERLLGLASLAAEDRQALEKIAQDARRVQASGAQLPKREVSGAELAQAVRFAVEVLTPRGERSPLVTRWSARPRLVVHAEDAEAERMVRRAYEDFCAAAGLPEEPGLTGEIVFCAGGPAYVETKRRELAPELDPVNTWRWNYWWDQRRNLSRVRSFVVLQGPAPDGELTVRMQMGKAFGVMGTSDIFADSAFAPKSRVLELAEVDRRLLRLLHRHLESGASREQVLRTVRERWAEP